jgi:hypothetical protein
MRWYLKELACFILTVLLFALEWKNHSRSLVLEAGLRRSAMAMNTSANMRRLALATIWNAGSKRNNDATPRDD